MKIRPYRQRALKYGVLYKTFVMESQLKSENGISPSFKPLDMTKLIVLEKEDSENTDAIDRLMANVRAQMLDAMERYLDFDLTEEEKIILKSEKLNVANAKDTSVLTSAINRVLDITFRFDRRYWLKRHD